MSTRFFVSQSPTSPAVIQGAYRWFCSEDNGMGVILAPQQGNVPDYDVPSLTFYAVGQLELPFEASFADQFIFDKFAEQWLIERGATSSTTEMILCSSYQSIIAMGSKAIPLILSRMEREGEDPDQWFWALQILTGANPVDPEDDGDFQKMARAWLQWATGRYVW